jgi:hypothetical protein
LYLSLYPRQVCSSHSVPTAGMLQCLYTYGRYIPVPLYILHVYSSTSVPIRQVYAGTSVTKAGIRQNFVPTTSIRLNHCTYGWYTPAPLHLRYTQEPLAEGIYSSNSVPTAGTRQSLCNYGRYTQEPLCTYGRYASVPLYLYLRQIYSSTSVPTTGIRRNLCVPTVGMLQYQHQLEIFHLFLPYNVFFLHITC